MPRNPVLAECLDGIAATGRQSFGQDTCRHTLISSNPIYSVLEHDAGRNQRVDFILLKIKLSQH